MFKNGFNLLIIFCASAAVSMGYQNCGGSTIKANNSQNDDLEIVLNPDNNDGFSDPSDGDSGDLPGDLNMTFNLGDGDFVFFEDDSQSSTRLRTVKLYGALYDTILESRIYSPTPINPSFELPQSYCANSALAHCQHQQQVNCQAIGCPTNRPIGCVSQRPIENDEISTTFQTLNDLRFLIKNLQPDQSVDSCDVPTIRFAATDRTIEVALAPRRCINDQQNYASQGGPELRGLFERELDSVASQGQHCNRYGVYAWNTTNWSYRSRSGSVNPTIREVNYVYGVFDLKWKDSGDPNFYCVDRIGAQNENDYDFLGFDIFFPDTGIPYRMFLTDTQRSDAATAEITYTDPIDNGRHRQFFLNQSSAEVNRGGPVIADGVAQAMRNHIETIINRAKEFNMQIVCGNSP